MNFKTLDEIGHIEFRDLRDWTYERVKSFCEEPSYICELELVFQLFVRNTYNCFRLSTNE